MDARLFGLSIKQNESSKKRKRRARSRTDTKRKTKSRLVRKKMDIDPAENEAPSLKNVLRNFRYGLIYDISSVGVYFTSVFRYCVLPCPGGWPGPGG